MFVRTVDELRARGEEIVELDGRLRSFNLLTKADGLGFSLHDVRSAAGTLAPSGPIPPGPAPIRRRS